MAKPHNFSPKEAVKLRRQGKSLKEIAEISKQYGPGLTVSGVQQLLQGEGETKKYVSHKEALPWPNKSNLHSNCHVAERLRWLSHLAQGNPLHKNKKRNMWWTNEAINWANEIIDSGMDIDYDRDSPPNDFSPVGGYFLKPADPEDWHIEKLMNRVRHRMTRKLG